MARKRVERNISYDDVRKKFYVNLDFGFGTNGKQIKKTQTFSTITEARKALRAHEVKKDRGEVVQPRQTTVADWLRYWLENIVRPYRAETTVYGYRNMIENYLVPRLGKIQLQALTPQKIQRYYTDLLTKTTLSANTVRKHHDLLRTALDVAVRQQMIATNPADRVEAPKTKTPERHFYSPQDLARLLQCAEGHRLELVIKLAAYLGLRREEYCGLHWSDVDFAHHVLHIRGARTTAGSKIIEKETKTVSSTRSLHMPAPLEDALRREYERQQDDRAFLGAEYHDTDLVLVWSDGHPYKPNYLSELFTKFVQEHNLPPLTLHGLRHTFATLANQSGATLYDISKALGHSTVATTSSIYTHILDGTHENVVSRVASVLDQTHDIP